VDAFGMLEFNSIPSGIEAGDAMLKAADVRLMEAHPVCAGKYVIAICGEVAAVQSSISAGREVGAEAVVDEMVLANVHPQVISAIVSCSEIDRCDAIGIIETFSLACAVKAADAAVKAAEVTLIEVRLGRGLGGKSFVVLTGNVAAARHAVQTAERETVDDGMLARTVIIPSPHPDLIKTLI
jgi:microcompartment protein CcmL/EutN